MMASQTPEDQLIALRSIKRGTFTILANMVQDDQPDFIAFLTREEGKACDAWELRQSQEDQLLDEERWAADMDDFRHMSYGSS